MLVQYNFLRQNDLAYQNGKTMLYVKLLSVKQLHDNSVVRTLFLCLSRFNFGQMATLQRLQ